MALFEAEDVAKGTSSRATKLVHGGVRYLAQGNLSLVREALRERALLLGTGLAAQIGVEAGDRLTLFTQTALNSSQAWTFDIVGLVGFPIAAMSDTTLLLPLDQAQRFLKMDGSDGVTEVLVRLVPGAVVEEVLPRVQSVLAGRELSVRSWKEASPMVALLEAAVAIYNVVGGVFFLLGSTVIINTTMMVIYERMREIGTVAALGMTGAQIQWLFLLEALFISFAFSALGVVVGIAIIIPLSIVGLDFSQAMEGVDIAISGVLYPVLSLRNTLVVLLYSTVVAGLASLIPTRKAAKIDPVEALRA